MPPPAYRIAHKTPHSSMSMPHIFSEPRGPPGFGSAIRYPLSALAARRRPRSRRYSPPTYCAIARSPPWARGYHNHRSPVPALGTINGTVDACMIQSKRLRSISLGSGRAVKTPIAALGIPTHRLNGQFCLSKTSRSKSKILCRGQHILQRLASIIS